MNVSKIVKDWLEANDYDGLYSEMCGCELKDLMPCGSPNEDCKPGYKGPCECADGCCWHIGKEKREVSNG